MYIVGPCLFDLNEERSLQLEHAVTVNIVHDNVNSMGFLPNGDLILVSLKYKDCKIYCYSVENKPMTSTTSWECSQIHEVELITESLRCSYGKLRCFVCQT